MRVRDHIDDAVLLDYVENKLDATAMARVQNHLAAGCAQCAADVAFWSRMLPRLHSQNQSAPEWVLQRAINLFRSAKTRETRWQSILAALVYDSRIQALPAGARDLQQTAFKLLFEAEIAHVDLLCERESPENWTLSGQVLSGAPPELGWKVLLKTDSREQNTQTDVLGEFHLTGLEPGNYTLVLQESDQEIVLPSITL